MNRSQPSGAGESPVGVSFRRPRAAVKRSRARRGVAVVELAVLLPLLVFIFVVTVDFARAYYFSLTLQNCARSGALYASDSVGAIESPFASTEDAALSDATNLNPQPTITESGGTDPSGRLYVEVTAAYPFRSITNFPGIPDVNIARTVRMYRAAITPDIN